MVNALSSMGADITATDDGMIIRGGKPLHGAVIDSHLDHRIAMSFAIAGLNADGDTEITGAECVNISYPGFYDDLGYSYTAKFAVKPIKQNGTVVAGKYQITLTDVINSESKSILDANEAKKKTQIQSIFGTDGYTIEYDTNKGTFVSIGANGNQKPVSQLLKMSTLNTGYTTDLGNGQTQKSNFKDIEIDFSKSMNYDNGGTSTFKMLKGDRTGDGAGKKLGALTGISVDQQGRIHGSYDNGNTILLGQIAVAQFANASGLEKVGNNCYQTTLNSGEFDGIGVEITSNGSTMNSGELEMSCLLYTSDAADD